MFPHNGNRVGGCWQWWIASWCRSGTDNEPCRCGSVCIVKKSPYSLCHILQTVPLHSPADQCNLAGQKSSGWDSSFVVVPWLMSRLLGWWREGTLRLIGLEPECVWPAPPSVVFFFFFFFFFFFCPVASSSSLRWLSEESGARLGLFSSGRCHSGYGPPPPEDAVRHGSIMLANAVLPQRIRSAVADTIQL